MPDVPLEGRRSRGIAVVASVGPRGMVSVKADLADEGVAAAIREVAGCDLPAPLASAGAGARSLLWMAPDELLWCMPAEEVDAALSGMEAAVAGQYALAADVSDLRAAITVEGPAWREVLARLTPADVAPDALPSGAVRRTRLGQVAAALWVRGPAQVDVLCFRSVAGYAFDLLSDAASGPALDLFKEGRQAADG